jgi:hypothetical protein
MRSVLSQDTGDLADAGRPDIRQNIEKLCLAGGELVTDPPLKRFAVKYKRQGLLLQFAANYFQGGNLPTSPEEIVDSLLAQVYST